MVAVVLGRLYDLPTSTALRLTQSYHDQRVYPQGVRSPQTTVQRAQVCVCVCVFCVCVCLMLGCWRVMQRQWQLCHAECVMWVEKGGFQGWLGCVLCVSQLSTLLFNSLIRLLCVALCGWRSSCVAGEEAAAVAQQLCWCSKKQQRHSEHCHSQQQQQQQGKAADVTRQPAGSQACCCCSCSCRLHPRHTRQTVCGAVCPGQVGQKNGTIAHGIIHLCCARGCVRRVQCVFGGLLKLSVCGATMLWIHVLHQAVCPHHIIISSSSAFCCRRLLCCTQHKLQPLAATHSR